MLATLNVAPAFASDAGSAEEVASQIARVAPFQGNVTSASPVNSSQISKTASEQRIASLPVSQTTPVVVRGGSDSPLEVLLPKEADTLRGVTTTDGTVVYMSANGSVDVAAQILDSGKVRLQTVINSPSASHEFTYELGGGYIPVEAADGSLWAYKFSNQGKLQIYSVGNAWAMDANGVPVDTHYEVRNNSIVQIVNPDSHASYPIVADPTWEWYSAAYGAGFSKKETKNLANTGAIAGFCVALGKWPALAVGCALAGAYWFTQAALAANANGCVFIAAVPAPLAMRWITPQCK